MESDAALQREIRALLRERHALKSAIRKISAQVDSDAPMTLLSTRAAADGAQEGKRKLQDEMEVDAEKRPKLEAAAEHVAGQRRLLRSGLLGHLQRARDALEKEREKENTRKHLEKEQLIAQKLAAQEREKVEALSIELRAELETSEGRLQVVESELQTKNGELVRSSLARHYEYMSNFIATKTQPTVFWLPRNFNPELESLRDGTRQFIAQKVAAIASTDYCSTELKLNSDV